MNLKIDELKKNPIKHFRIYRFADVFLLSFILVLSSSLTRNDGLNDILFDFMLTIVMIESNILLLRICESRRNYVRC